MGITGESRTHATNGEQESLADGLFLYLTPKLRRVEYAVRPAVQLDQI
jgi:hypothetical protein